MSSIYIKGRGEKAFDQDNAVKYETLVKNYE